MVDKLPNSALIGITGSFSGTFSSNNFTFPPFDPTGSVSAAYHGPGEMTFTPQTFRLPGVEHFGEEKATTTTLFVDVPVPFDININGFAHLPFSSFVLIRAFAMNLLSPLSLLSEHTSKRQSCLLRHASRFPNPPHGYCSVRVLLVS
ncbi:MAG: hypothetical protein ABI945_11355 [Nitrospirales bacterium]